MLQQWCRWEQCRHLQASKIATHCGARKEKISYVSEQFPRNTASTTKQNQYFPANAERMVVHCLELGCIGNYIPLGPRDSPRAICGASGCKIPALGGWISQSLLSAVYRYNTIPLSLEVITNYQCYYQISKVLSNIIIVIKYWYYRSTHSSWFQTT